MDVEKDPDPGSHWLYRKDTIRRLWIAGGVVLFVTAMADAVLEKHPYFGVDGWFGFFSVFGFLSCVAMVFGAKLLGFLIKRPEDYYGD